MIRLPTASSARLLSCAGILLIAFSAVASGASDLEVRSISGPGRAHVGTDVLIYLDLACTGEPPAEGFVAAVVLTSDDIIDPLDPIVATLVSDRFGPQGAVARIPEFVADTVLRWAVVMEPAPGEIFTDNNLLVANPCEFVRTELQLRDPEPITISVPEGQELDEPLPVVVDNVGSPGSLLVFTVSALTPAPWLDLVPPTGFAVAGGPSGEVQLSLDTAPLTRGTYQTKLHFVNFVDPKDSQDLDLTITVGVSRFTPGNTLLGEIAAPDDLCEAQFEALEGSLLRLKVRSLSGNLRPRIDIVDTAGTVRKTIRLGHSGKQQRAVVKFDESGTYLLRLSGQGQTEGRFRVATSRKLPRKARPRTLRLRAEAPGGSASCSVLLMLESTLAFRVKPNASFAGPLGLHLVTPEGALYDTTAYSTLLEDGTLLIEGLSPTVPGKYTLVVSGYGPNPKAATRIALLPVQPDKGRGKIY